MDTQSGDTHGVHRILAHSYSLYFLFLLLGLTLDLLFPLRIFTNPTISFIGFVLLAFASILIFWAQHTSRNLSKGEVTKETFCKGPYCYTRTPTHWGLFILTLGFGILANAFFVVLTTLISFFVTKFFFVKRQEEALEKKYGAPYLEYKKQVKL